MRTCCSFSVDETLAYREVVIYTEDGVGGSDWNSWIYIATRVGAAHCAKRI